MVKKGTVFEVNKPYAKILVGMNVCFTKAKEDGRNVLRLLLPDPNGILPGEEGCEEPYERQLHVIV